MATSADAEAALAALLWQALAPIASQVKVIRGWPSPKALDNEINAGNVIVSVYRLDVSRNTTRYLKQPVTPVIPPPTLTATISGSSATFVGSADLGQIAGVIAGGVVYALRVVAGDTPPTVAAKLAALMPGPVIVSGATITAAGLSDARTAADATALRETGRQENTLQADIWCPTPGLRDQAESLVIPVVSGATFLPMPDGSGTRTRLGAVMASDQASPLTIYRLMLRVTAEYVVGPTEADPIVLWPGVTLGNNQVPLVSVSSLPVPSGMMTTGGSNSNPNTDTTITFTETVASGQWTITHNLNRYPNVTVIDTSGHQVEPDIDYLSLNVVQLTFSAPLAGIAYLS